MSTNKAEPKPDSDTIDTARNISVSLQNPGLEGSPAHHDLERGTTKESVSNTATVQSKAQPSPILQVLDFPFQHATAPGKVVAECTELNEIDSCLDNLSPLNPKVARLYVNAIPPKSKEIYMPPKRKTLYAHLGSIVGYVIQRPPKLDSDAIKSDTIFNPARLKHQWSAASNRLVFGVQNLNVKPTHVYEPYSNVFILNTFHAYIQCMPLEDDKLIGMFSYPTQ